MKVRSVPKRKKEWSHKITGKGWQQDVSKDNYHEIQTDKLRGCPGEATAVTEAILQAAAASGRVGEATAGLVRGRGTAGIPTSAHQYEYCMYAASVDLTVSRFRPFE